MIANALIVGGVGAAAALIGAWIALRLTSSRVRRMAGRVEQVEGELRARERSSEEGRHVQDVILAAMQDGVLLVDSTGRKMFANAAFARHLDDALPPELVQAARRAGYTGAETGAEVEAGGRWLRGTAIPVGDDGSVLLVIRDVTESRRLDRIRRDFVANASHELKTPAASILAAAETIRSAAEGDPAAVTAFAASMEREALRLTRIVSDLLDLSRLEGGSELGDTVRLDELARREVDRLRDAAAEGGVELTVTAEAVPPVRGSARDLALLVRNLVDNAVRYTKAGGRVSIGVAAEGTWVRVRVADTGVGIPSRDLGRVFERFYRVDRARSRETGGTGLGLAIVKHVVENHGGDVSVQSELDRGTTFTVRLPAAS